MPIQQQNPVRIGFIPVLTSLTIFVFRPIADIAMMIRNLLSSFNGGGYTGRKMKDVVTTDARTKNSTNIGKARFRLKEDPSVFLDFRLL